jgi:hypothetical protein
MLILKRLSIWLLETALEALLLGVALSSLLGVTQHAYVRDSAVSFVWISTMFFSTGYLFTTGIARAVWQPRKVWLYSALATLLFFIHFEILSYVAGGIFDPTKRAAIRLAGGCIVVLCTMAGGLALRRWTAAKLRTQPI